MIRRALLPSLLTLCAALFLIAASAKPARKPAPWGKKEIGILLASPDEGRDFDQLAGDLRKSLGPRRPLQTVAGTFGTRELQRALDKLQSANAKKIVVIPLYLHTQSRDTDQLKYLLGIRKYPSKEYIAAWRMRDRVIKRAKAKVPIVMGGGLDDHSLVADILLDRAKSMSRKPKEEAVVLAGIGSSADQQNKFQKRLLQSLAGKMLFRGQFQAVQAALLRPADGEAGPEKARESEKALRKMIYEFSKKGKVIVVPHLLSKDGSGRALKKKLDNLFYLWKGEALLPDKRIGKWIETEIKRIAELSDMVEFKDAGLNPPAEKPLKGLGKGWR